jgi:hypothetical protein
MGERGQILTISRMLMKLRISGICKEGSAKYGPFSDRCSRIILSPTGAWVRLALGCNPTSHVEDEWLSWRDYVGLRCANPTYANQAAFVSG